MKFIVMSDLHYIAESMIINDRRSVIDRAAALQSLDDAAASDYSDVILITGDLTDRGDKESHEELIKKLREIRDKTGKKIYVTTATHDFNHNCAYTRRRGDTDAKFTSEPWGKPYFDKDNADFSEFLSDEYKSLPAERTTPQLAECYTPDELWDFYREFGRDQAYSAEDSSFCYCLDLDENTRCLMLNDNFRNEEAMRDNSVGYSPACYKWIAKMVKEAKEQGKFLFVCTHHPLLPPSPAYRIGGGNRDMRSPYSAHTLADIGITLALTGHSHFSDVGFAESPAGNILCDITTPSVRHYPPRYRLVDLDGKAGKIAYKCVDVSKPEGVDIGFDTLTDYYFHQMYDDYSLKIAGLKAPFGKIITEMKVKDILFLVKRTGKLTEADCLGIRDMRVFDLIITAAFNMLTGDGKYTPDTAEYKVLMAIAAIADSVIDAQPFVDIKKSVLKGYSVKEVIEPLCCNSLVPDNEAEIDFTVKPESRYAPNTMKSFAGDYIMALLCLLVIPVSKLLPYAAIIGVPAMTIMKKIKNKDYKGPNYKY